MSTTYDVRFWDIRKNEGKRKPYEVRWVVGGREKSRSHLTKALAENFKSQLNQAARAGEAFDLMTGLPEPMAQEGVTWFQHSREFADMKWPRASANHRRNIGYALSMATLVLVRKHRNAPDRGLLRKFLLNWAFNPGRRSGGMPSEYAPALAWLERASLSMKEVDNPAQGRRLLDALSVRLDGKAAAALTYQNRRVIVSGALNYAMELGRIRSNPMSKVSWTPPESDDSVDRRCVVNPKQARSLLDALKGMSGFGDHLRAFFALLYYAALRPGEANHLKVSQCVLPEKGWGRLDLTGSSPEVAKIWSDDGMVHENRPLKHRSSRTVRQVPIPPELVAILRDHIERYGTTPDGRLFRNTKGDPLDHKGYAGAWARARKAALTPDQVSSPLAARPYDLRHAAVSLWLNNGVAPTEVAERAGHSVAVLLKIYAKCIDGHGEMANKKIENALREGKDAS